MAATATTWFVVGMPILGVRFGACCHSYCAPHIVDRVLVNLPHSSVHNASRACPRCTNLFIYALRLQDSLVGLYRTSNPNGTNCSCILTYCDLLLQVITKKYKDLPIQNVPTHAHDDIIQFIKNILDICGFCKTFGNEHYTQAILNVRNQWPPEPNLCCCSACTIAGQCNIPLVQPLRQNFQYHDTCCCIVCVTQDESSAANI